MTLHSGIVVVSDLLYQQGSVLSVEWGIAVQVWIIVRTLPDGETEICVAVDETNELHLMSFGHWSTADVDVHPASLGLPGSEAHAGEMVEHGADAAPSFEEPFVGEWMRD